MKAVILAAGIGSRLRPFTKIVPKCMVEVNNVKIVEKQISNLIINGVKLEDIIIVIGYKYQIIEKYLNEVYKGVNIIVNNDYDKTNNMYSLNLTKEYLKNDDFILMNADVYYESEIIKVLLNDEHKNLIVCDNGKYIEESMKISKKGEKIIKISKNIKKEEAYGVSIDVYKFSKEAGRELFKIIDNIINVEKDFNSWTEVAIDKLLNKQNFYSLDMKYKWVEIDNHEDLKYAEKLF